MKGFSFFLGQFLLNFKQLPSHLIPLLSLHISTRCLKFMRSFPVFFLSIPKIFLHFFYLFLIGLYLHAEAYVLASFGLKALIADGEGEFVLV